VAPIAATRPAWASLVTSLTPDRPRAVVTVRSSASRPRPRWWTHPGPGFRGSARPLTPVAIKACTLTTRPPSRTSRTRASAATNVYGPASSGRVRKDSTAASSSLAITDTCDFDNEVMPRVSTRRSIRRVETPSR
jgi:hypothetical protein